MDAASATQQQPYDGLAAIYDYVMRHVDYVAWTQYVDKLLTKFGDKPRTLVDLACGTGNNTLQFGELGYHVTGIDGSTAMVNVANGKAAGIGHTGPFFGGDLRCLGDIGPFDAATCLYDSFNYMLTHSDVSAALVSIAGVLEAEGIFVFDVCTERNSLDHFRDVRDSEKGPGFVYSRHSYYDEYRKLQFNSFDISLDNTHVSETHKQRIYAFDDLCRLIADSPFDLLAAYEGFTMRQGSDHSDRIHFVLQRVA